jgi:hypothetical protein
LARRYPTGFGRALCALDFHLSATKEIALIHNPAADPRKLVDEIWRHYLPNKVVAMAAANDTRASELIPLLRDRKLQNGKATAYICENRVCQAPVTEGEALKVQLLK